MSLNNPHFPGRESNDSFEPLNRNRSRSQSNAIPLQEVVTHGSSGGGPRFASINPGYNSSSEKPVAAPWRPGSGFRKATPGGRKGLNSTGTYGGQEDALTKMGRFYNRVLSFSIISRYILYVLPLAFLLAIPIVIGAATSSGQGAYIGGVRIVWLFVWLEVSWVGLWVSKIVAQLLPAIFQFLCGIVSSGTRKYALVIKKLEIPLSLAGWALVTLSTFYPIMQRNPDTLAANTRAEEKGKPKPATPHWESVVQQILAAAMISAIVFLAEKLLIEIISIDYHRKQFTNRIAESKHKVYLLSLLYDASRALFPQYCPEFADEDALITSSLDVALHKKGHGRSGSTTPLKLIRNVGRVGDKVTSAFGNVAQEITGKQVFNPDSAHSIVVEALEKTRSSEALARRLWMSFVVEGQDALYQDDIVEVLGAGREVEAEECFTSIDNDMNGDISLDEMILHVTEISRERYSLAHSLHDVEQAISALDKLLLTIVVIVIIFVFLAFLNTSFVTTLATAGTALLSLSFVFSATAQEVLGSCIFLFVKHPYDIGDRVDLNYGTDQLVVEQISLLYTVFRRVTSYKTVQIPHIVLNGIWVENVSRSKAMREQLSISVSAGTSLEDIQLLKGELGKFVTDKENNRDFQPIVEIEVLDISDLSKLDLMIEVVHKSNWGNEAIRASRRSKLMCAIVLALRNVPIYGPGGGAPALGDPANPSYSVAISDIDAIKARDKSAADRDAARMIPNNKETKTTSTENLQRSVSNAREEKASQLINERSPAIDGPRENDELNTYRSATVDRSAAEMRDINQMQTMLRRETTKGKRRQSDATTRSRSNRSGSNMLAVSQSQGQVAMPYTYPSVTPPQPHPSYTVYPPTPSDQQPYGGGPRPSQAQSPAQVSAQVAQQPYPVPQPYQTYQGTQPQQGYQGYQGYHGQQGGLTRFDSDPDESAEVAELSTMKRHSSIQYGEGGEAERSLTRGAPKLG